MAVVRGNLGKIPGRAGVRDAVDRKPRQRAHRPLSPRHAPGRFSGVAMPDVSAIDLRAEKLEPGKWLSQRLVAR